MYIYMVRYSAYKNKPFRAMPYSSGRGRIGMQGQIRLVLKINLFCAMSCTSSERKAGVPGEGKLLLRTMPYTRERYIQKG